MALAAVRSKAVVLLLLMIYYLMYFPLFVGVLLICITFVHSSFAIILKRKGKVVALLLLSYRCTVTKMFCGSSSRCRGLICSV